MCNISQSSAIFQPSANGEQCSSNITPVLYSSIERVLVDYVQWTPSQFKPMAVCSVHSIHWLCYFGRLLIFSLIHHSLFLYFLCVLDYSSFCALATSHHRRSDSPKFEWLYNSIDICNTPVVYSSIHLFRFQFLFRLQDETKNRLSQHRKTILCCLFAVF